MVVRINRREGCGLKISSNLSWTRSVNIPEVRPKDNFQLWAVFSGTTTEFDESIPGLHISSITGPAEHGTPWWLFMFTPHMMIAPVVCLKALTG